MIWLLTFSCLFNSLKKRRKKWLHSRQQAQSLREAYHKWTFFSVKKYFFFFSRKRLLLCVRNQVEDENFMMPPIPGRNSHKKSQKSIPEITYFYGHIMLSYWNWTWYLSLLAWFKELIMSHKKNRKNSYWNYIQIKIFFKVVRDRKWTHISPAFSRITNKVDEL